VRFRRAQRRATAVRHAPGIVTGPVLQTVANAMQELNKKIPEHVAEQAAKAQTGQQQPAVEVKTQANKKN
jgi:hypothetical protein